MENKEDKIKRLKTIKNVIDSRIDEYFEAIRNCKARCTDPCGCQYGCFKLFCEIDELEKRFHELKKEIEKLEENKNIEL